MKAKKDTKDMKDMKDTKNVKEYVPAPIDTGDVELPEDLLELTEKIAENVHDVWAAGRIAEGWTYGEKRDDVLKKTPCLVAYEDLSESEKDYDRKTALNTLKLVIALGYRIEKKKERKCRNTK